MPSSYSTRLRFTLQASGENTNTWGQILNSGVFSLVDKAIAGGTTKAITGNVTLTSSNGSDDEARAAWLKLTGSTGATITIPSVEKTYLVWNASTADQVISTGAGSSATIGSEQVTAIICDGTNVMQLGVDGDSFKDYVDAQAFAALNGDLPAQTGNAGKYLGTDGSAASWTDFGYNYVRGASSAALYLKTASGTTLGSFVSSSSGTHGFTNSAGDNRFTVSSTGVATAYADGDATGDVLATQDFAIAMAVAFGS